MGRFKNNTVWPRLVTSGVLAAGLLVGVEAFAQVVDLPLGASEAESRPGASLQAEIDRGRLVARGSRGAAVRELQQILQGLGYTVSTDGVFGPRLDTALRSFQRSNRLYADGKVGPRTLGYLRRAARPTPVTNRSEPSTPTREEPESRTTARSENGLAGTISEEVSGENYSGGRDGRTLRRAVANGSMRRGAEGEAVRALQRRLAQLGYGTRVDGDFGPSTERALRNFQRTAGLTADGVLGPRTLDQLVANDAVRAGSGSSGGSSSGGSTTTGRGADAWINTARAELGTAERSGSRNNSRIVEYHRAAGLNAPDSTAWCASFMNWVFARQGIRGTGSAAARSFLNWGTRLRQPVKGAVVVFWRGSRNGWQGHVGIFMGFDRNGNPLVLGGNQDNRVSIKAYPRSRVLGYRWPPGRALP